MSVVPMSQRLELEIKDKQISELDLSENPIVDGLDTLTECPKLETLNLSGNKLKAVADLAPLASLEHLKSLELNNCDIAAIEDYRKEVFAVLPKLKYLDGLDQSGGDEPVTEVAAEAVTKPVKVDVATEKNGSHVEEGDDEEDDDEDDDEEEEEEVGISALQGSKELEDDEEDYVPAKESEDAPSAKCKATDEAGDHAVETVNGSKADA
ncbi:unnamed protein product [Dibothriocephalus latus]|uniref:U2A'/phosphoprotein 32 family A C-terminal domain-containing protein n=1 Tax=Dibothriocephalus latus TaxID=60516 RepID=A0A3P7M7T8_DIBLA|nr:unnamed protein product [Dibothriocephalus latus]